MEIKVHEGLSFRWFCLKRAFLVVLAGSVVATGAADQDRLRTPLVASAQIVEDLVLANRILTNEGVVDGLGHVSARHDQRADRFLLSRGVAPALVVADDVMEYDLEGNPVDWRGRSMYGERFIHAAIYRARPDVKAIVHCHTPSVLPFANSNVTMRPIYQMSAFLASGAPVFEIRRVGGARGMLVSSMATGHALAQTLSDKAVVLMRGHGAVVVGESLAEAVSRTIHLDISAKMQVQSMALGGTVRYLEAEDLPAAEGNPYGRLWEHWKQRLPAR